MQDERDDTAVDDEQEVMLDWIETHWDELAAFAWKGYVTAGRGIVLLEGDWDDAVTVGYQTAADAEAAGTAWPAGLREATQAYTPATDIVFFVQQHATGTLLGMRATAPRLPPRLAGQRDGAPPLVPTA